MKHILVIYDNSGNPVKDKQKEFENLDSALDFVKNSKLENKYLVKTSELTNKSTNIIWSNLITGFPEFKIESI